MATETRPVSGVTAVELQFHGDLSIDLGDEEQLVIEAEDNLLQYLETQVLDGTLIIRKTPPNFTLDTTEPIRYHLTVTELESLTTTTSGNIDAPELAADRFSIMVKSSGSVYVEALHANHLEVVVKSSGNVTVIGGEVESQDITLSSSGYYDGQEVECKRATVRISSSGDATLRVLDRLDADLSSSGNLYYSGDPIIHVQDSSSEGRVIKIRRL